MGGVRAGDVIAGKFRVERVLGEGGMGYVVAARHLQLGQPVALKFIRDDVCTREYKARFMREARNGVRLKSRHVARILDVGELDRGVPYIVMEYLDGTDLSDLLHAHGPFAVQEACEYVLQACEAIAEAHAYGIVHRDLKPANLFLTRGAGGEPIVKVLDFGVSKLVDLGLDDDTSPGGRPRSRPPESVVTQATDLLGSPSYMSPEQVLSARDADTRSDVWSLGVILFRLVSGKAPFAGASLGELIQSIMQGPIPSLREARPDIPAGLEHVVARCLVRDRNARLADAAELARLLAPYAGPNAAPSLERIALIGAMPVAPPAMPRAPSMPSLSNGRGAWTAPSAPPPAPRSPWLANVLWAALFFVVVGTAFVAAVNIAKKPIAAPAPPVASTPMPAPTTSEAPSVATVASSEAAPAPAPAPPPPPAVTARAHVKAKPPPSPARRTSSAPAVDDIPSTRD